MYVVAELLLVLDASVSQNLTNWLVAKATFKDTAMCKVTKLFRTTHSTANVHL